MSEKRAIDATGALILTGFSGLLALNQVVIKVTAGGLSPVFQAGLRSVIAGLVLLIWMLWRKTPLNREPAVAFWGTIAALLFVAEFTALYTALDLTSVSRVSVLFYTMPVWLGLAAHFLLPGEQLTPIRWLGMALAMGGVALALLDRPTLSHAESGDWTGLIGDALAILGAMGWASIALVLRMTPLSRANPEAQLMYQLGVSAPIFLIIAPLFGPLLRDLQPIHLAGLGFQAIAVASLGFLLWFRMIAIYSASGVASFSFLAPVLAVIFGWLLLNETIGFQVWIALALVAAGVVLINRR